MLERPRLGPNSSGPSLDAEIQPTFRFRLCISERDSMLMSGYVDETGSRPPEPVGQRLTFVKSWWRHGAQVGNCQNSGRTHGGPPAHPHIGRKIQSTWIVAQRTTSRIKFGFIFGVNRVQKTLLGCQCLEPPWMTRLGSSHLGARGAVLGYFPWALGTG